MPAFDNIGGLRSHKDSNAYNSGGSWHASKDFPSTEHDIVLEHTNVSGYNIETHMHRRFGLSSVQKYNASTETNAMFDRPDFWDPNAMTPSSGTLNLTVRSIGKRYKS